MVVAYFVDSWSFYSAIYGFIENYPESHNYPKRFNEANAKKFYLNSRKMINQLKNSWYDHFCLSHFKYSLGNGTLPVL
ncbi:MULTISPECIES: hypothetical protein [Clostridia]|uniref:hypothetical protein n=1 Tax=Clostridia TaxID=186801 RepID=UPI000EA1C931|nr:MULTISPECIES: hypothetical protein [Clostridia]NBJ67924.1 hypothetical protein [Roseburia sp. 1XD42-34]RKI82372.1 hypothetical protein D7V87_00320 [Clostridium sp. 1xD42-85]